MTRDDIIRLAREARFEQIAGDDWVCFTDEIERFASLVAAAEREACAKVCEGERRLGLDDERAYYGDLMAAAIRARGQAC